MQSSYDVILTEVPNDKEIFVANIICQLLGLNAKDAVTLATSAPIPMIEQISKEEAEALQRELEQVGAKAEIKESANFKPFENYQSPNINHSDKVTFLNKYYLALASVDHKYQKLLQAQNELNWYQHQLEDANKLTMQLGFENISQLSISRLPLSSPLLRKQVEAALANALTKISEYNSTERQKEETISRLQGELSSTITNFESELKNLVKNMEETYSSRESLRTKKLIEVLLLVAVGILTAFISKNLLFVLIFVFIAFIIRASMN